MKLLQQFVARHYDGGSFSHCTSEADAEQCGDGLFLFTFLEAGDASSFDELADQMDRASDQLRSLADEARIAEAEHGG